MLYRKPNNRRAAAGNRRRLEHRATPGLPTWAYAAAGLGLGAVLGPGVFFWPSTVDAQAPGALAKIVRSFTICHTGGGTNCVVDGDTIWLDGQKILIADIDTSSTHEPRCDAELQLGQQATVRLHQLINAGPFEVSTIGNRDRDRYGRALRVPVRNSRSLGDMLVSEGLARTWDGARHPWC